MSGFGKRLHRKVVLITGAGAGIGAAAAKLFLSEGASVMLVDTDEEALAATLSLLPARDRVHSMVADVSDEALAREAVGQVIERFGALTTLVNNAARRQYIHLADASNADWQAMLNVNTLGVANYCRAALPSLRKAGTDRGASIVNVSSCYALVGRKNMGLYDATKAAMLAITRTLAHEETGYGVRVNAICPGSTLTDFHTKRASAEGKSIKQLSSERQTTSIMSRWATPEEIAWPILWLASDEASFITGASLPVDGGLTAM
jgi:2-hydroxycyclohexanecarboxyl-CoA dehydrogenase